MPKISITTLVAALTILSTQSALAFEAGSQADACMKSMLFHPQTNTTEEAYMACRVEVLGAGDSVPNSIRIRPIENDTDACKMISILTGGVILPEDVPQESTENVDGAQAAQRSNRNGFRLYRDGGVKVLSDGITRVCENANH